MVLVDKILVSSLDIRSNNGSHSLLFAKPATQYVGMGKVLYDKYPEARAQFEEADDTLGESLSSIIFDGPADALTLTANTQPAVLTTACAAWRVLAKRGFRPSVVAGHSLGEYGALVAAGLAIYRCRSPHSLTRSIHAKRSARRRRRHGSHTAAHG